jgi:predicted DNA-binding helix-hairpin-helix protein
MNELACLNLLASQMFLEPGEDRSNTLPTSPIYHEDVFIHPAVMPNGKHIRLLKTLLSSACERDCYYCPFRAGRDTRRATFSPENFARLFVALYERRIAEGIFISSGMIGGGIRTQDKLIDTIELLRNKYRFQGYVHLKIMPGSEKAQVERAMQISDRVSLNLEAPNTKRLLKLAPHKNYTEELIQPLAWIDEIRKNNDPEKFWKGHFPSSATQFVVGAGDETDVELLTTTVYLYKDLNLKRVYYSAFKPAHNTPLENIPATNPTREFRLYQASFLLRNYPFKLADMVFDNSGNLPLDIDPKLAWANNNLLHHPIELNQATKQELMKIPGIGSTGADKIIINRRKHRLTDVSVLGKLGLNQERIIPFVLVNGKRPPFQMNLMG